MVPFLYPGAILVASVVTGNHYLLDAAGAASVVLLAFLAETPAGIPADIGPATGLVPVTNDMRRDAIEYHHASPGRVEGGWWPPATL